MTTKIRILPENLCNQIAAGEVVERPASVVKELIENSLDANATEIRIDVESGGRKLIRVTDDGDGMGKDDVFLCLERHATSKISMEADLFSLNTLGFRGEALPSIAAVSRLTVRSRTAATLEGWEVYVEGGTVCRAGAAGLPVGTSIEVRDLFFNTPARRKFLRKEETELGHIAELVTRLALAAPEVQFKLTHNQRPIIETPRHKRLEERIAALLGRPLLTQLAAVDSGGGEGGLELRGFVSRPELTRSSTGGIYTYINGRHIRDRVVLHAVLEGVRHLVPKGRYPAAILFMTIPPDQVDVNVHPTKHEVRFSRQAVVHDFIVTAIRDSLRAGVATETVSTRQSLPFSGEVAGSFERSAASGEQYPDEIREAVAGYAQREPVLEQRRIAFNATDTAASGYGSEASALPTPQLGLFAGLTIIGQFNNSYIVAEDREGLILIDQHAAHERIGFERLLKEFRSGEVARQALLFPQIIEFDFKEAAYVAERLSVLSRLGYMLEPFGGRSYALQAVPVLLKNRTDHLSLLRDLAAELAERGVSTRLEAACENLLVTMSCHAMVRANQALSRPEITALLRDLDQIDFNASCPHGRPVYVRLTTTEIARLFRRSA